MANYIVSDTDLKTVADAIRAKGGKTEQLAFPAGFESAIEDIETGGGATEPYAEYTFDASGNMTAAKLYGFTSIPAYAFYYQRNLETVDLSESPNITSIGASAFYGCLNLILTSLPNGVTRIDTNAFKGCAKLAITSLPSDLTKLGDYAFADCSQITLTSLPRSLTEIGLSAFSGCSNITLTVLPNSVTKIGTTAFYNCVGLTNMEIACSKLGTGTKIFAGCTNLQKVWIRDTCTTITASTANNSPFMNCSDSLEIYAEPSAKLSGWGTYYNRTGSSGNTTVAVTFNQTTRPW